MTLSIMPPEVSALITPVAMKTVRIRETCLYEMTVPEDQDPNDTLEHFNSGEATVLAAVLEQEILDQ